MKDNFDDIKDLWLSGDHQAPDIEAVKRGFTAKKTEERSDNTLVSMGGCIFIFHHFLCDLYR